MGNWKKEVWLENSRPEEEWNKKRGYAVSQPLSSDQERSTSLCKDLLPCLHSSLEMSLPKKEQSVSIVFTYQYISPTLLHHTHKFPPPQAALRISVDSACAFSLKLNNTQFAMLCVAWVTLRGRFSKFYFCYGIWSSFSIYNPNWFSALDVVLCF